MGSYGATPNLGNLWKPPYFPGLPFKTSSARLRQINATSGATAMGLATGSNMAGLESAFGTANVIYIMILNGIYVVPKLSKLFKMPKIQYQRFSCSVQNMQVKFAHVRCGRRQGPRDQGCDVNPGSMTPRAVEIRVLWVQQQSTIPQITIF